MKIAVLFFLLISSVSQARIFDMGKAKFASFLRGSFQPWGKGGSTFENSSGASTDTFNKNWTSVNSYEFGLLYSGSGAFIWKFAIEILQPPKLGGNTGGSAAGVQHFDFSSELNVVTPKIGLEIPIKQWKATRLFFGAEYGMANMTAQNNYSNINAGVYPAVPDYREEVKSVGSQIAGEIGFETLMSDTSTFCIDIGYRQLKFSAIQYNVDVTPLSQPGTPAVKGDAAKNNDGTSRAVDLSGVYASVSFRIWIF